MSTFCNIRTRPECITFDNSERRSMLEFLATLPPGPLLFKTPADANRYIQQERDAWER